MGFVSKYEDENDRRGGTALRGPIMFKHIDGLLTKGRRLGRQSTLPDAPIDFELFGKLVRKLDVAQKAYDKVPKLSAKAIGGKLPEGRIDNFIAAYNNHIQVLQALDRFLVENIELVQPGDYRNSMARLHEAVKLGL
jgi:hypothetical protein